MQDFDDIVRLLREERPQASELELDQIKQRVMKHADAPRKGQSMRSRFAILLMLVAGMLMSGTGAALSVQGFQGDDDASQAQYPTPSDDDGGVLGEEDAGGELGEEAENEAPAEEGGQVAAQVEAGDSLPFTGFAAIPVLIGGVALVGGGLALRRRASND
jgi:hypothetical protein